MANTESRSSQASDLRSAVRLLEYALRPSIDVTVVGDPEPAAGAPTRGITVVVRAPRSGNQGRLQLRPQGDHAAGEEQDATVWVMRRVAPDVARQLREDGASFVDLARGIVRIELPWLLVDRSGLRPPKFGTTERAMRDPFGDRASLVPRVLIEQPARDWTTRALAEAAGVSTMTSSHAVRQLNELGVLDVHVRGRANTVRLRDARRLVELWTARYQWRRNASLAVHAPIGNPERFLRRLPEALGSHRWALTLQAGASLVAPHAAWDKIHLYVDVPRGQELSEIARRAGWEPGDGRLVLLRPWYAQSVWYGLQYKQSLPVVSELQLILDLWDYPVRGHEQAEHLLARLIGRIDGQSSQADAPASDG
jgi:hypothetical protein